MTREEAMKELSYIIDEMPSMECADWIEAISMGIKALDQEPCTDVISRQAVLDAMQKLIIAEDEEGLMLMEYNQAVTDCIDKVEELPPVTPAEKVGHWIDHQDDRWIYAKCSECGTVHDTRTNYCPNCGAKMGGEQNEHDYRVG